MGSNLSTFITTLQKSKLFAECPNCMEEFPLSKALLFDGTKQFPSKAEIKRLDLEKELEESLADLVKRHERATTGSEKISIAVGIGKIIEKILPAHKDFKMVSSDCRFLGEPIDMIAFQGLSENKINKITFLDVKTGNANLNKHQKQIRDAVRDYEVKWKVV